VKHLRHTSIIALAVLLGLALPSARAALIPLNSGDGIGEYNNFNNLIGPNVLINVHPVWKPNEVNKWVSYGNTGEPRTITTPDVPDPITLPNPNLPSATFYEVFVLPYWHNTGHVDIWADDTARVYLDQVLLIDANPVQGINCGAGPIGCTPNNVGSFDLTALHLSAGPHTLALEAYQRGGSPFGVMYQGSITSTPEPITLALIGAGLLGLGLIRRRKQA